MMGKHYYPPTVDLVITLLYLDLCNHRGDFCDIVGKTYTGGACVVDQRVKKAKGVALIEDDGDYSGVMVAVRWTTMWREKKRKKIETMKNYNLKLNNYGKPKRKSYQL